MSVNLLIHNIIEFGNMLSPDILSIFFSRLTSKLATHDDKKNNANINRKVNLVIINTSKACLIK